jgi:hypothetical protein
LLFYNLQVRNCGDWWEILETLRVQLARTRKVFSTIHAEERIQELLDFTILVDFILRATPTASLFLLVKFEGLVLCKNRKLQNSIE